MKALLKRINQKNTSSKQFSFSVRFDEYNAKNDVGNLNDFNNQDFNKNPLLLKNGLNFNFHTPIKNNVNISRNLNNNLLQLLENILNDKNVSTEYTKKVIRLFENFIEYLINTKKNKELFSNYKKYNKYIIKRIKMSDVEDFIFERYKNSKPSTIYNIKSRMRRFIRIINNEPHIDYSRKIFRPKSNVSTTSLLSKQELFLLLRDLNKSKDSFSIILLYFLYFLGLNYSFIARILLTDFKSNFTLLILKKGKKVIKHYLPNIIVQLLFQYFIESRSYNSYYFFEDNFLGNNGETRTMMIKDKTSIIFEKAKYITNNKKKKLLSDFSKLRRAKPIASDLAKFFILSEVHTQNKDEKERIGLSFKNETINEKLEEKNKSFQSYDDSSDSHQYFSFDESSKKKENNNFDSICGDFDFIYNDFNSYQKSNNKPIIDFLKRKRKKLNGLSLKNGNNNLLNFISEAEYEI